MLKKKIWVSFQRIIELFTKELLKNRGLGSGIRDPGSGKKPILNPGSRGQKGTWSRIRIRYTGWRYPFTLCEVRWKLSMVALPRPETDSREGGNKGRSWVHLCKVLHNPGQGYRQLAFRTALVQHLHQKENITVFSIQTVLSRTKMKDQSSESGSAVSVFIWDARSGSGFKCQNFRFHLNLNSDKKANWNILKHFFCSHLYFLMRRAIIF